MVHRNFGENKLNLSKMNGIRQRTEAEIDARRARTDQISKLMGQYLLKGHKMLATYCDRCSVSFRKSLCFILFVKVITRICPFNSLAATFVTGNLFPAATSVL